MTEPTFDSLVRDTSFAGETTTSIADLKGDVVEIKADVKSVQGDVKHMRRQMDHWGGAFAVIGATISALVSVAVALLRP